MVRPQKEPNTHKSVTFHTLHKPNLPGILHPRNMDIRWENSEDLASTPEIPVKPTENVRPRNNF